MFWRGNRITPWTMLAMWSLSTNTQLSILVLLQYWTAEQVNSIQMICVHTTYFSQCKHLLYPVTVKKGTLHWFHSRDYYLIITQTSLFGIQNGKSCRSVMPGITVLPMGAVIWRTDYYPDTVRNGRLHCKCLQGFTVWLRGFSAKSAGKTL